jgi:hypothetical protein
MRLHERTMHCQRAEAELGLQLLKFQEAQDLTDLEMLIALQAQCARLTKYMLRAERHPDDPDKKADEA